MIQRCSIILYMLLLASILVSKNVAGNCTNYDGTTCAMPQGGLFFVAEASGDIFVSEIDGDTLHFWPIPLGEVEYPVALDYHPSLDLVFWSEVGLFDSSINRANSDGSAKRTIFAQNVSVIDGLALDLTQDRVYWTDTGFDTIGSMNLDGSDSRVILSDDLDEPRAIVIHDGTRKMFWTDWGNAPKIEKANLDGSSREVIVDTQLIYPNGLAFSSDGQTLFWCEAGRDRIESVDLNGGNRQLLLATSGIHPFDLAVFGNRIFWSDWSHRALGYSDDGGASHSFIHDHVFERPMGIHLYPGDTSQVTQPPPTDNPDTHLICDSSSMTLIIARSLLDVDDKPGDVHFEDESCVGYDHDIDHIAVTTFYDECSTEQKQTEDNIVYTNTVTYNKPRSENGTDQVITREHNLQVPVTCLLEREEVLSESFKPDTGKVLVEEIGYGEFSLSLNRFEDNSFSKKANESQLVNLGEPIYFGASLEAVSDLSLFIESCWATPVGYMLDDRRYDIITDGCADDSTVVFHDTFGPAFQAFQIDAFTFIGEYPQVFVHCTVLVCDQSDATSRCTAGCQPRTRRSVRQLGASSKPHAITSGPLSASQLPSQISSNQRENEIRPYSTVAMATLASLLVVIALLLILVLVMMYRRNGPKALGYRRVGLEPLDP